METQTPTGSGPGTLQQLCACSLLMFELCSIDALSCRRMPRPEDERLFKYVPDPNPRGRQSDRQQANDPRRAGSRQPEDEADGSKGDKLTGASLTVKAAVPKETKAGGNYIPPFKLRAVSYLLIQVHAACKIVASQRIICLSRSAIHAEKQRLFHKSQTLYQWACSAVIAVQMDVVILYGFSV